MHDTCNFEGLIGTRDLMACNRHYKQEKARTVLTILWTFVDMEDNCSVDACGRDFAGGLARFHTN
jgi:hypothetical protein